VGHILGYCGHCLGPDLSSFSVNSVTASRRIHSSWTWTERYFTCLVWTWTDCAEYGNAIQPGLRQILLVHDLRSCRRIHSGKHHNASRLLVKVL
jgi:hypothetical protein